MRHSPVRIFAVIVLYRCSLAECSSLQSLLQAATHTALGLHILLVDNSPQATLTEQLPANTEYLACPENLGLANAYNRAVERAELLGCSWLLTLDQDTGLTTDFLARLKHAILQVQETPAIAAVVPQIAAAGRIVSPNYFQAGAIARWFTPGYIGTPLQPTFAFNSAATLRVDAIRQVGGYSPWFWLDNSDAKMFHSLHLLGKRVYVMGDVTVQHDFSMTNLAAKISPWRYENILLAESAFWDADMNRLAGMERTARLAVRWAKHLRNQDSPEISRITRRFLWMRLFRTRTYRRRAFHASVERHLGSHLAATVLASRPPKVSVCMAAYNGGTYVERQIFSILPQLSPTDELLIVDDKSTDDTAERIAAIQDPRIHLIRHHQNAGVIASFEDAIRNATGDILFLSDDDDIWNPHKVARFLEEFQRDPRLNVVHSAVTLIDSFDKPFTDKRFDRGGKSRKGFLANLVKNSYQGSAMAFRSRLIALVLPFPRYRGFLHDVWIGTRNDVTGGKTRFLAETLLEYRRHSKNFSNRLVLWKQLRARVWLFLEHARLLLRSVLLRSR